MMMRSLITVCVFCLGMGLPLLAAEPSPQATAIALQDSADSHASSHVGTRDAATRPTYEVLRTNAVIHVDGNLDESAWAAAPLLGPFVNNQDGSPSPIRTEAKILYDDKFIYFAFRSVDQNIWATMTKRDAHLWEEEVVEVFVQAEPRQTSYIELEVNPLGAVFDAFLLDIRKPLHYESWNSEKLQWAVKRTAGGQSGDKEWTCEIALPLEDVVTAPHTPPQPGDRWRVNLYRIERVPVPAKLAWSPTMKDFHVPERFGEIVFSARTVH